MINEIRVKEKFAEYVRNYDPEDPKIALKITHTYRVAEICRDIAKHLAEMKNNNTQTEIGDDDVQIAWLSGMLHDIGRFEQIRRYNTFIDAKSVDHAQFGADLLFGKERLIESFTDDRNLDELLETAIREHNKFEVGKGIYGKTKCFCNILRDADKIDILRVNYETPMEEIYNTTREELLSSKVSEGVIDQVKDHITVTRDIRKTYADHLIGHIALVFGLVYDRSYEIVKEQGYIYKLLDYPMTDNDTKKALEETRAEIAKVIG
ncbi:MAG: HD domain-containing protein [Lachnospiraceae bacterium]|nr:HD domain-containing protein [Lachnospiraceae bacterium]